MGEGHSHVSDGTRPAGARRPHAFRGSAPVRGSRGAVVSPLPTWPAPDRVLLAKRAARRGTAGDERAGDAWEW